MTIRRRDASSSTIWACTSACRRALTDGQPCRRADRLDQRRVVEQRRMVDDHGDRVRRHPRRRSTLAVAVGRQAEPPTGGVDEAPDLRRPVADLQRRVTERAGERVTQRVGSRLAQLDHEIGDATSQGRTAGRWSGRPRSRTARLGRRAARRPRRRRRGIARRAAAPTGDHRADARPPPASPSAGPGAHEPPRSRSARSRPRPAATASPIVSHSLPHTGVTNAAT